ncbi:hypothetical protein COT48_05430 [Candidatus Woesearchaeota archaeon CG08_land_8_20_14_0_20_47_9]|nr:MAG: hypothetical protein AUJ69_01995 [Candidatus Woesearchaeota archaeon CG1_02_47_18]PIN72962.1 MAG: hypothetical protein COV22_01810 [Candidatus Woesearchaeota archaeon CG10_big_fil_rev_8_21_14_0_10_47_5]PIO03340.1 MAG: hypothetical protein COT48_05430 [Candidatus Woesearchaeota archaeon CG08_land_8_20_14_0_20_47_9]
MTSKLFEDFKRKKPLDQFLAILTLLSFLFTITLGSKLSVNFGNIAVVKVNQAFINPPNKEEHFIPEGPIGVFINGGSNILVADNYLRGFEQGIIGIDVTNLTVERNTIER